MKIDHNSPEFRQKVADHLGKKSEERGVERIIQNEINKFMEAFTEFCGLWYSHPENLPVGRDLLRKQTDALLKIIEIFEGAFFKEGEIVEDDKNINRIVCELELIIRMRLVLGAHLGEKSTINPEQLANLLSNPPEKILYFLGKTRENLKKT